MLGRPHTEPSDPMMKAKLLIGFLFSAVMLSANWNIEKPAKKISGELRGEIFGREFELGKARWTDTNLTLTSKDKVDAWPASRLLVFVEPGDKQVWRITPSAGGMDLPNVHMRFAKKGNDFPGTLMFTGEYAMHLEVVEKTEDMARFKIHLSLPDYKKSWLKGTFEAKMGEEKSP